MLSDQDVVLTSVEQYLSELAGLPVLSRDEEAELSASCPCRVTSRQKKRCCTVVYAMLPLLPAGIRAT